MRTPLRALTGVGPTPTAPGALWSSTNGWPHLTAARIKPCWKAFLSPSLYRRIGKGPEFPCHGAEPKSASDSAPEKMYDLPRPGKGRGCSDDGSPPKCIRPLASGPLLRPGHDEIRTPRSQILVRAGARFFTQSLRCADRLFRHHSLEPRFPPATAAVRRRPGRVVRRALPAASGSPRRSGRSCLRARL